MARARYIAVGLAVLVLTGAAPLRAAETKIVTIENLQFQPVTLTVKQGDTVVWRNADLFPHNVVAQGGAFRSPEIAANGRWTYTAKQKGEFGYACTLHPSMKGTLIVH
ncbi:MAG: cupredoxin family copper-binding protein [Sulfurifustis sp.]